MIHKCIEIIYSQFIIDLDPKINEFCWALPQWMLLYYNLDCISLPQLKYFFVLQNNGMAKLN